MPCCQDALVRLGSAEQTASRAEADAASARGEANALMEEVDNISDAFAEMQEQNGRLLKNEDTLVEAKAKAMGDWHKEKRAVETAAAEAAGLRSVAAEAKGLATRQEEANASLETQLALAQDTLAKKDDELRKAAALLERQKCEVRDAQREALQSAAALAGEKERAERSESRESSSAGTAATSDAAYKTLAQERDGLKRQVTAMPV